MKRIIARMQRFFYIYFTLSDINFKIEDLKNLIKETPTLKQFELFKRDYEADQTFITERLNKYKDEFNGVLNFLFHSFKIEANNFYE